MSQVYTPATRSHQSILIMASETGEGEVVKINDTDLLFCVQILVPSTQSLWRALVVHWAMASFQWTLIPERRWGPQHSHHNHT